MSTKYYLLIISLVLITNNNAIQIKIYKNETTYHPFQIDYDFSSIMENKNKKLINSIQKLLNQVKRIFSQFLNIKGKHLLQLSSIPNKFCDKRLIYFNTSIIKGFQTDLLIFPILEKRNNTINELIDSKICAIDNDNKRPVIALLLINNQFQYNNEIEVQNYLMQIIHQIVHILGFNRNAFNNKRLLNIYKRIHFYSLRNVNEKDINAWLSTQMTKNYHFQYIKNDIMSSLNNRKLLFSSQTLAILQRLNWYQINLSLCGLSEKGDFEYLRHSIKLYISQNLNKDYNVFCYFKETYKKRCSIENNEIMPKKLKKKINSTFYPNYFDGKHFLNRRLIYKNYIPEPKKKQQIHLLTPKKNGKCKNKQRTLYVYYPKYLKNLTNPDLDKYDIKEYTINNKNMRFYFTYYPSLEIEYPPINSVRHYNNISYHHNVFLTNFVQFYFNRNKLSEILGSLGKYQVVNTIKESGYIFDNKAAIYRAYRKLKNKFPKDFNFHPESFILSEDKEIILKKFKNYTQTKDNLWIYKPPNGLQGLGIKFMKNEKDFLKYSFINKYISNPHLLYGKKYHFRLYFLITGILPLKIYIFNEGQVMRATKDYTYNFTRILFNEMLTNAHMNAGQKDYNRHIYLESEEGNEWTMKTFSKYCKRNNINWNKIWNEIKDIVVKIVLANFSTIQNNFLNDFPNLRSNNVAHRYGFDIMIDDNLKPWFLEVNSVPGMEFYNIINRYNKIKVDTDYINLIGLVPFDHITEEPLDKEMKYKDKIDEAIQLSICEFERPHGGLERIFPVKNTLNYYKQFIDNHDKYNKALWDLIENGEIE